MDARRATSDAPVHDLGKPATSLTLRRPGMPRRASVLVVPPVETRLTPRATRSLGDIDESRLVRHADQRAAHGLQVCIIHRSGRDFFRADHNPAPRREPGELAPGEGAAPDAVRWRRQPMRRAASFLRNVARLMPSAAAALL